MNSSFLVNLVKVDKNTEPKEGKRGSCSEEGGSVTILLDDKFEEKRYLMLYKLHSKFSIRSLSKTLGRSETTTATTGVRLAILERPGNTVKSGGREAHVGRPSQPPSSETLGVATVMLDSKRRPASTQAVSRKVEGIEPRNQVNTVDPV